MGAIKRTVGAYHFRFKPEAKLHAQRGDMIYNGTQAIGVFAAINLPIPEGCGVIITMPKPPIVKYKTFCTQGFGLGCDLLQN